MTPEAYLRIKKRIDTKCHKLQRQVNKAYGKALKSKPPKNLRKATINDNIKHGDVVWHIGKNFCGESYAYWEIVNSCYGLLMVDAYIKK